MNIIFFGTSSFAVDTLASLLASAIKPVCVVTTPDTAKGRGLQHAASAVKTYALMKGLDVLTPASLTDDTFIQRITDTDPDIFIVASYGKRLPKAALSTVKKMSIGVHPSLLPQYRGAAPIHWALANGESATGVTIFKMDEAIDGGEIILQKKIAIDAYDDIHSLTDKLTTLAASLVKDALILIEKDRCQLMPQPTSGISLAPKLTKEDGHIVWDRSAHDIVNRIRAFKGWPGTFTYYNKKMIKIIDAKALGGDTAHAQTASIVEVTKNGIFVACKKSILKITKVQPQGGKIMDVASFLCGHTIEKGSVFE